MKVSSTPKKEERSRQNNLFFHSLPPKHSFKPASERLFGGPAWLDLSCVEQKHPGLTLQLINKPWSWREKTWLYAIRRLTGWYWSGKTDQTPSNYTLRSLFLRAAGQRSASAKWNLCAPRLWVFWGLSLFAKNQQSHNSSAEFSE